jgi:tetratricopeptide (TPR) repeat protein
MLQPLFENQHDYKAMVLQSQGKLDDAMEMYGKALEIRKKTLGEDHFTVAVTYNNMAGVLQLQGKLDDAMEMYGKALEIRKKTLGEDHFTVAVTYNNMAIVLKSQGKLDDAIKLYRKALEIYKSREKTIRLWHQHTTIWRLY